MKLKIANAVEISNQILQSWGFSLAESESITENLIEAELAGKKTHGLMRLPLMKLSVDETSLSLNSPKVTILEESHNSLLIDGNRKTGFYVINKALDLAFQKVSKSGLVAVGLTNTAPTTGFVGLYARKAAERDLIYIGFSNCEGGLVPFGSKQAIWGTNPFSVGIPAKGFPIILDMASSEINWGKAVLAKKEGKQLSLGVAIDRDGNLTTDPAEALIGGLLPFSGSKGSGMAFIIELLAGALTKSRVGYSVSGGWGTFFILIDPNLFRSINEFKEDISTAIKELKESEKMNGVDENFYPGEKSQLLRQEHLKAGFIEVDDSLYAELSIWKLQNLFPKRSWKSCSGDLDIGIRNKGNRPIGIS